MATLEQRLVAAVQAIGTDVKAINIRTGALGDLTTTDKTSLVLAINELMTAISALQAGTTVIDDNAGNGATTVTWSADKIFDSIVAAKQEVVNSLVDGADAALNTLKELADALQNNPDVISEILSGLNNRVAVDAVQAFTNLQKTQGRDNIGAASQGDLDAVIDAVGNTDVDLVAAYNTAKA